LTHITSLIRFVACGGCANRLAVIDGKAESCAVCSPYVAPGSMPAANLTAPPDIEMPANLGVFVPKVIPFIDPAENQAMTYGG
jgi:hypothetical protein